MSPAAQLTRCRCGQGMVTRKNFLVCLHCDQPCEARNCHECRKSGVKG